MAEPIVGLAAAVLLGLYLLYTLIRPGKILIPRTNSR